MVSLCADVMKSGKRTVRWVFGVTAALLGLMVLELFASTPLFLSRIDLRQWARRSNIPLAVGNPVTGTFPFGRAPTNLVPVYGSTNRPKNPSKLRILFLGNSLIGANNMASVLTKMATKGKFTIEAEQMAHDGYTLEAHAGDLRSYNLMTNVWPDRWNFTNARPRDAIIMQEHTVLPVYNWIQMRTNIARLNTVITNMNSQGMLFMTWSRPDQIFDKWEFMDRTDGAYTLMGQTFNMPVVPVGRAWQLSEWRRPDIVLRQRDSYLPTIHGTYLNACLMYCYLTWQSPVGLSKGELWAIRDDEAFYFQNLAWEVFQWRKDGLKFW